MASRVARLLPGFFSADGCVHGEAFEKEDGAECCESFDQKSNHVDPSPTVFNTHQWTPLAFNINPRWYYLDVVGLLVSAVLGIIAGEQGMKMLYTWETNKAVEAEERRGKVKGGGEGEGAGGNDAPNTSQSSQTESKDVARALSLDRNEDVYGGKKEREACDESQEGSGNGEKQGSLFDKIAGPSHVFLIMSICVVYPALVIPAFRAVSDFAKAWIVCAVHPIIHEVVMTLFRRNELKNIFAEYSHDQRTRHYCFACMTGAFLVEFIFITFKRTMLGCIANPVIGITAVVVTSIFEAVTRSTMVMRDKYVQRVTKDEEEEQLFEHEVAFQRRIWTCSIAMSMYMEVTAIMTTRVIYILMRPHRFAFNFGYGYNATALEMTSVELLFLSFFFELLFELVVDVLALRVEADHGIDLAEFWEIFRITPFGVTGFAVSAGALSTWWTFWAFTLMPTPLFCSSSSDPCSCSGGGFGIYTPLCSAKDSGNVTAMVNQSHNEYPDFVQTLGTEEVIAAVTTSMSILLVIVVIFWYARKLNLLNKELAAQAAKLKRAEEMKMQVMLDKLDGRQQKIVKEKKGDLLGKVPERFQLDWRKIKFLSRIGAGSFGDAYKGELGNRTVAIKRMRLALVHEEGFSAFCKEVATLASLEHDNIVEFVGYVTNPQLLIVMEFVGGGTLKDFIKFYQNVEGGHPTLLNAFITFSVGCARALGFMHAFSPSPILHRDVKSENILLTKEHDSVRLADFGEAREMAAGQMTVVGTRGYTAPEVLKGEHYGPPADVFSFSIVMCELITLRFAYDSYLRDESGSRIATWDQVVEMSKAGGLRPELNDDVPPSLSKLIRNCWNPDPERRPTFSVILTRLANVVSRVSSFSRKGERAARAAATRLSESVVMSPNQKRGLVEREMRAVTKEFFDLIQNFKLGIWKANVAAGIINKSAKADATDAVISAVLMGRKGPECARSIGQIIFGSLNSGWEVVPEPLIRDHITVK